MGKLKEAQVQPIHNGMLGNFFPPRFFLSTSPNMREREKEDRMLMIFFKGRGEKNCFGRNLSFRFNKLLHLNLYF